VLALNNGGAAVCRDVAQVNAAVPSEPEGVEGDIPLGLQETRASSSKSRLESNAKSYRDIS